MIRVETLSKHFSGAKPSAFARLLAGSAQGNVPVPVAALNQVSMTLRDGNITGLLGLNGAGKSTLLRLIYGLMQPSAGQVFVNEVDVSADATAARRQIGVLPDDTGLYKRLTARENIAYFGRLQGMSDAALSASSAALIERLGMQDIADRRAEGFSLGERMKTALARALVHNPQHILLDEPTNGLDVLTTRSVRQLLLDLKQQGRCIVFSSHLMHEISGLCDRLIIIHKGRIVMEGTLPEIRAAACTSDLEEAFVQLIREAKPGHDTEPSHDAEPGHDTCEQGI